MHSVQAQIWEVFLSRIEEEISRPGENQTRLAKKLGVSSGTMARWLARTRGPEQKSIDDFKKYAKILGVNLSPFLTNPQKDESHAVIKGASAYSPPVQVEGDDLQTVYIYQKAAAGNALALSDIEPLCEIKIPFKYIAKFDFAVLVDGHSMEPTIKHESVVGAKENFDFVANELYVAHMPYEGLVVKRVAINRENQTIIFKSDNLNKEHYPDIILSVNESEKFILGRVVWIMYRY